MKIVLPNARCAFAPAQNMRLCGTDKLTDPTSNRSKSYRIVLDGLKIREIGSLEGWQVATGDKIEVENVDYNPIVKTAP